MDYDFRRKESRLLADHFLKFFEDPNFLLLVIKHFLERLMEKPSLKEEDPSVQKNFLSNFAKLLQMTQEMFEIKADMIYILIQVIIQIHKSNNQQLREYIKDLGLLESRDNLLI